MRKTILFLSLLIGLFLLTEISVDASRAIKVIGDLSHNTGKLGAYRALVIGINDYDDPKIPDLKTAVNDGKTVAELLRERYGFQVQLLLDGKATKRAIYQALRNLASSATTDDSVLIYYAGHGDLDRTYNDGWWIPVDAVAGDPVTYLDNVHVQKAIRSMKARHCLLISDSCYSGTLFGEARAMPPVIDDKYYLNLYNEKSRWGMTSGNKTPVSDAGTGGHSVFAYQLINTLRKNKKPYISTQEIYTQIAPIVSNNSEQTPMCRPIRNTGDQGGEFVFIASSGAIINTPMDTDKVHADLDAERKRLEQERKELEWLKVEAERKKLESERKRIEAEKQKLQAMIKPPSTTEPSKENEFGFLMHKTVAKEMGILKPEHTKFLYKPTVCLQPGTVAEENAAGFFSQHQIQWTPVAVKVSADFPKALLKSTCKCAVSEISQLEKIRDSAKNPSDYVIFPMGVSARRLGASGKPGYFIRMYNIDDVGRAYLNDQLIKTVKYKGDSDWVEITSMLNRGKNEIKFTLENGRNEWTYGFQVKKGDEIIWEDECGDVERRVGCIKYRKKRGMPVGGLANNRGIVYGKSLTFNY